MAYVPAADADFNAPLAGDDALWPLLIANDAACYEEYSPGLESNMVSTGSAAREFRLRMWGNLDNAAITVGVRAEATSGGPHTITIATPGVDSDTDSVSVAGLYGATVDARGPCQEVIVSCAAVAVTFSGIGAYHAYSAPVAGTRYPSRYRLLASLWGTSGYPIGSEQLGRLRRNPQFIARDRPVCVAAHIANTALAITAKTHSVWGAYNTTAWERVGKLQLPRCDVAERLYRVDAYTNETTPGTAEYAVRVGGGNEHRWTGPGWHSWQVRIGPGPHEVKASCKPGASNGAAIRSLLIWRTEL